MKLEEELAPVAFTDFEPGLRTERRKRARRRSRALGILLAMALLAGVVWAGATLLAGGDGGSRTSATLGNGTQTAYLFMVRRDDDLTRRSDMLAVFAVDRDGRNPVTMLIPTGAFTEIPGHGDDFAGRGFSFGSMSLQSLVVDNMLGIKLDNAVAMTDVVIGKLVDQVNGLDIEVQSPLLHEENGAVLAEFEAGTQHMDGAAVRRYLAFQAADETELSRLARAQQVWDALIERWGDLGTGVLAQRFRAIGREYRTGLETGLQPLDLAEFFMAFAAAGESNRVYTTLPVTPISAGGTEPALRIDQDAVAAVVRQYFSGSIPANPYRGMRLEVQNGNGVPQIGEKVGLRLIPAGFRFVLDRNAKSFDIERTRIIVYDRGERSLGAARKIRDLLGVGEIQIGVRSQTLVDVTIIVGHDFGQ
jgi:anionic cell wall polymer biosynthesis LytR-Cps2A-Psr (LCP) family protein